MTQGTKALVSVLVLIASLALAADVATAGWLSRLTRGASEVEHLPSTAGKLGIGLGALEGPAAVIAKLPPAPGRAALAAHVTPEGHWKFINRDGDVFTAASAEELARAAPTLAPDLGVGGSLSLHLSEESVFTARNLLKDLPPDAELSIVVGRESFRLKGRVGELTAPLAAEVRPGLTVALDDRASFREATYLLGRPLNRSNVRVLALSPGGPKQLSSVPRFDPVTKGALVDEIDPGALAASLGRLKGQTVLVSGRVEGDVLVFKPASGSEQKLFMRDLSQAARSADVNLVVIDAATARQPGGRNWLWQKVEVAGLEEALKRATFADFLASLGSKGGELAVTASPSLPGRVTLRAVPSAESLFPLPEALEPMSGTVSQWMAELTGHVAIRAVEVEARDADSQDELDLRLVPGIPSTIQLAYLISAGLGLAAVGVAYPWWCRIWPPEERAEYRGSTGYQAARLVRLLAFLFVFLPLIGFPAVLWSIALQLWALVTAPARALRRLRGRLSGA